MSGWENLGALGKVVDVGNAEKAEAHILASIVLIPLGLVAERNPLVVNFRVCCEFEIGWELEDTLGSGNSTNGLVVEERIPDTRSGILWGKGLAWIDELLLRSRVGTEQSSEAVRSDSLVLEKLNEIFSLAEDTWKETIVRSVKEAYF